MSTKQISIVHTKQRERERDGEREGERETERGKGKKSIFVFIRFFRVQGFIE